MERLNKMNNKKNSTIELLRFVFLTCIMLMHCNLLVRGFEMPSRLCPRGAFGVEFFFLVSGALMAKSAMRNSYSAVECFYFIWRKFCRLWPHMLIAMVLTIVTEMFWGRGYGIDKAMIVFMESIGELFFLQMAGLNIHMINGPIWYISAMLLAMWILYPLLLRYRETFIYIIAPLLAIFIHGWLLTFNKEISADAGAWAGQFVKLGLLRAIADLSLGSIVWHLAKKLDNLKIGKLRIIILRVLSLAGIIGVLMWIALAMKARHSFESYLVFILAGSLVVLFSDKRSVVPGGIAKFFLYMGTLTMIMYMNHRWIISLVKYLSAPCRTYELYVRTSVIAFISVVVFAIVYNMILSVGSKILKKDSLNLNLTKGI